MLKLHLDEVCSCAPEFTQVKVNRQQLSDSSPLTFPADPTSPPIMRSWLSCRRECKRLRMTTPRSTRTWPSSMNWPKRSSRNWTIYDHRSTTSAECRLLVGLNAWASYFALKTLKRRTLRSNNARENHVYWFVSHSSVFSSLTIGDVLGGILTCHQINLQLIVGTKSLLKLKVTKAAWRW